MKKLNLMACIFAAVLFQDTKEKIVTADERVKAMKDAFNAKENEGVENDEAVKPLHLAVFNPALTNVEKVKLISESYVRLSENEKNAENKTEFSDVVTMVETLLENA